MARRIHLQPYLSIDELEHRYRTAKEPSERTWWQILWLLAQGWTATELSSVIGYRAYWIGLKPVQREPVPTGRLCWSYTLAGWHTSVRLRVPEDVHLLFLPPYSPELQPAGHRLATNQHRPQQPAFRGHRRAGGHTICSVCRVAAPASSDPLDHPLSLVAAPDPQTTRTQKEIVCR